MNINILDLYYNITDDCNAMYFAKRYKLVYYYFRNRLEIM